MSVARPLHSKKLTPDVQVPDSHILSQTYSAYHQEPQYLTTGCLDATSYLRHPCTFTDVHHSNPFNGPKYWILGPVGTLSHDLVGSFSLAQGLAFVRAPAARQACAASGNARTRCLAIMDSPTTPHPRCPAPFCGFPSRNLRQICFE